MIRIVLPVIIVLSAVAFALTLVSHTPEAKVPQMSRSEPPQVKVIQVQPKTVRLTVSSQGIVTPRIEIDLVAEVVGKVIRVHPAFVAGGSFVRGEVLVSIDPRDYDYAVVRARSRLAEAQRLLAQEEVEADQAHYERRMLGDRKTTPYALHEPQLAQMRARVAGATASLTEAELQRARCDLRAPFNGRIRKKWIDAGQYVERGEELARLYSTASAEVRLPLSMDQMAYLQLPLSPGETGSQQPSPAVTLTASFGGTAYHWAGRIVRTEGVLDPATGLLYAVAAIPDPFVYHGDRPPLLPGTFVQAIIDGREPSGLFILPPSAVNASREAVLVDTSNRLRFSRLDIFKKEPDRVLIRGGLQAGDHVVISGVTVPVEGMEVKVESVTMASSGDSIAEGISASSDQSEGKAD